jgi:hypothetical protein
MILLHVVGLVVVIYAQLLLVSLQFGVVVPGVSPPLTRWGGGGLQDSLPDFRAGKLSRSSVLDEAM